MVKHGQTKAVPCSKHHKILYQCSDDGDVAMSILYYSIYSSTSTLTIIDIFGILKYFFKCGNTWQQPASLMQTAGVSIEVPKRLEAIPGKHRIGYTFLDYMLNGKDKAKLVMCIDLIFFGALDAI